MHSSLLYELHQRRFSIRARWEALLRAEPVTSALADPDALVHLIETTLTEIFSVLENDSHRPDSSETRTPVSFRCPCGRNPLLAYFAAGRQAMLEGLIFAQTASASLEPIQRDASLEELTGVVQAIAAREIEAFCGICQFRHLALAAPAPALCSRN